MSKTTPRRYLIHLRDMLIQHFNKGELKSLCFDLNLDYENLPGEGKAEKAQELVAFVNRNNQLSQLVNRCEALRLHVNWRLSPKKVFIAYKRANPIDSEMATMLHNFLVAEGHTVFIDKSMRTGIKWLDEIDKQIKTADFLLVLLSPESADSEMVQSEVRRAYDYREQQGKPQTLPIRITFDGLLPYTIDAFLNKYQYISWESEADNERLKNSILAAVDGRSSNQVPIQLPSISEIITVSEDGRLAKTDSGHYPPLPEFDPSVLEVPGGTVKLSDQLYIERDADILLKEQMLRSGSITTIRGSRQSGKSSLLVRGIQFGRENKKSIINLDFQRISQKHLENMDVFLRYLATYIFRKRQLDTGKIAKAWDDELGSQDNISDLIENHILSENEPAIILAMDEVDRLLETSFHTAFFGLVRSWYNNRASFPVWEKLNIVMAISTEPYLLITDINQSPFNVGLELVLKDFTSHQIQDLNQRHRSPVSTPDFAQFKMLLNGHPFLTRKAMFMLATKQLAWAELIALAATDRGPFSDHLRRQLWLLRDEPSLQKALKQIMRNGNCSDEVARYRLKRAGLIIGGGDAFSCRCDLYRQYFEAKLG